MKADKTIKMKRLSDEEGWELFSREALRLRDSTSSQWAYILNQLKAIDPLFYRIHEAILMELFKSLKYSYDALKAYELRLCFLYLAAYREEEEIDADQLIQVWLAEGLVKSREEGRYSFLKVLEDRCLVEIVAKEDNCLDIWKLKIHDVLKDMTVHIAEVDQNTLFHAVSGSVVEVVPEGFLEKLNMLKVFDLSNTPITFLPKSIHQLKHLLYLLLYNTQAKVIPDQTFDLSRMHLLDLSFSPLIKSIPSMIKKLKCLQILQLTYCYDLEFVSCDISQLTRLEELDMWNTLFAFSWELTDGRELKEASLQDVCKLLRLKRLRLTLKSLVEEEMVGSVVEIHELWLLWMPEVRQTHLPSDMRAMQKLERVHPYGCDIEPTTDLFSELRNLKYLKLNSSQILLTLSGLGLGRLSNLKKIVIEEYLQLKDLGEEFGRRGCFPRLCKLKLWMLPSLESLCSSIREGSLLMLQNLVIFRCMNVKVLPSGLYYLKSLGQIRGDKEWWNEINWEDEEMKKHLHAKYVEIPDNNNV
ncbi:putative disease resistance protein RGA4 [Cryptomeria japonica]|uniref:putative disease resistance protein RGA4 n=1 Tax=Cryptomeria japonica TaxID=3369 RepID=UPI0027DA7099|nr:putative disease resistance protein RGA4 [Cryptomeria japonica]